MRRQRSRSTCSCSPAPGQINDAIVSVLCFVKNVSIGANKHVSSNLLLPVSQRRGPVLQSLDVLKEISRWWRRGIPTAGWIVCVNNVAALLESGGESIAVSLGERTDLLQVLGVDVVPVALNNVDESDVLQAALPCGAQRVVELRHLDRVRCGQ